MRRRVEYSRVCTLYPHLETLHSRAPRSPLTPTSNLTPDSMNNSPAVSEEQVKAWKDEQDNVASQVIILEDEMDNATISNSNNDCYEFVNLKEIVSSSHSNSSSRSKSNYYFGGVDVTFPTEDEGSISNDDPAVAVYCIVNESCETVYLVRSLQSV